MKVIAREQEHNDDCEKRKTVIRPVASKMFAESSLTGRVYFILPWATLQWTLHRCEKDAKKRKPDVQQLSSEQKAMTPSSNELGCVQDSANHNKFSTTKTSAFLPYLEFKDRFPYWPFSSFINMRERLTVVHNCESHAHSKFTRLFGRNDHYMIQPGAVLALVD